MLRLRTAGAPETRGLPKRLKYGIPNYRASARSREAGMTTEVPGYVSKTDLVAALIRELIITGELETGEQLRQRDLAQRFGVSQTPVREAMRRLESEGLLRCDTHRGFT